MSLAEPIANRLGGQQACDVTAWATEETKR